MQYDEKGQTRMATKPRRRRILRAVALVAIALALILAVISVVLLNPPKYRPADADVVVVIAGATDGRHDLGRTLIQDGVADNLVVSNPRGERDEAGDDLCNGKGLPSDTNIWCMKPDPTTTTGEAQTFEEIADQEGWDTAVAVTNRPHHYRVRMNFEQCTDVDTTVASIDYVAQGRAPYHIAREIGGYIKHAVLRPC